MSGSDDTFVGWAIRGGTGGRHWHYFREGWSLCYSGNGVRAYHLVGRLDSDRDLPECQACKEVLEKELARGKRVLVKPRKGA